MEIRGILAGYTTNMQSLVRSLSYKVFLTNLTLLIILELGIIILNSFLYKAILTLSFFTFKQQRKEVAM